MYISVCVFWLERMVGELRSAKEQRWRSQDGAFGATWSSPIQHISTPWLLYRNGPHLRDSFFGDSRLKSVEVCASARFRSTKSCWRGSSLGRRRWANLELLSRWCFFPQWEIFGNPLNWGNLFGNIALFFLGLSDQQLRLNLACTIQLEPGSPRSSSA